MSSYFTPTLATPLSLDPTLVAAAECLRAAQGNIRLETVSWIQYLGLELHGNGRRPMGLGCLEVGVA